MYPSLFVSTLYFIKLHRPTVNVCDVSEFAAKYHTIHAIVLNKAHGKTIRLLLFMLLFAVRGLLPHPLPCCRPTIPGSVPALVATDLLSA